MTSAQACQILFGRKRKRHAVATDNLIDILWRCLYQETCKGCFESPNKKIQWNLRLVKYLLTPQNVQRYVQTATIQSIYGTFLYHPEMHLHEQWKTRLSLLVNQVNHGSS